MSLEHREERVMQGEPREGNSLEGPFMSHGEGSRH